MAQQAHHIRLLAAIMFADMVGYTKMMQEDESNAKRLRDRQRKVIDSEVLKHNGNVMQYYGDGMLCMFGSAIDAVKAAQEIQLLLKEEPQVPVRIGIHIGDVVYDDEGVYGDAVNISARVQGLAVPGSVMFSGKVFEEVRNHPGLKVKAFGEHELKNVFHKTGIYALAMEGLEVPETEQIQLQTGSFQNSIAVLPFANFSKDPENEYFSDGITEEIINALANTKGIEVASRTSVFSYKNQNKDIREIGRNLNVSYILEGSVRMYGEKIRVTAQFINVKDGFHLWSENFNGELTDIFKVQDDISRKIVKQLVENYLDDNPSKIYEASTDSIVAYNHYLKGLFHWNKRTPESVRHAITHFNEAINSCSTYTNAFSAIANCYSYLGALGQMNGNKAFKLAEEYARESIRLNSSRADSFIAMGFVDLFYKRDFAEAEAAFRKAITIEPNDLLGRLGLAYYNRAIGNYERMVHHNKIAVKLDPLSLPAKYELARAVALVGNHDEAHKIYDEILEMDPNFRGAIEGRSITYSEAGDFEKAMEQAQKYLQLIDTPFTGVVQIGYVAALKGDTELAEENIRILEERQRANPEIDLSIDFALIYASLGKADEAFEYLNKAVDRNTGAIIFIGSMFPFHKLKDDPRYGALLEKIGIPRKIKKTQ